MTQELRVASAPGVQDDNALKEQAGPARDQPAMLKRDNAVPVAPKHRQLRALPLMAAAIAVAGIIYVIDTRHAQLSSILITGAKPAPRIAGVAKWAVAAPGRIEARNGEIRVSASIAGRIVEVVARVGDKVEAGDLLIRLEDEEPLAQVRAADADSRSSKRERDKVKAGNVREFNMREAEDKVDAAERLLRTQRAEQDRLVLARRNGAVSEKQVSGARSTLSAAVARLAQANSELRDFSDGLRAVTPTSTESIVTTARAKHAAAEAQLEKTRIRAPVQGTILQVQVKLGEMAAPTPEQVLIVIGDTSALRVRTEVDERDIGKVNIGQSAVVKVEAFPDKEFPGKVATIAPALSPPKLGARGPRKPLDIDVLEVMVDVDGASLLLPGMRADVLFKR